MRQVNHGITVWLIHSIYFKAKNYEKAIEQDERELFKMIHEYPLGGKPPMMTHLFEDTKGTRIIAAKGAPEAMMNVSNLLSEEKQQIEKAIKEMALPTR